MSNILGIGVENRGSLSRSEDYDFFFEVNVPFLFVGAEDPIIGNTTLGFKNNFGHNEYVAQTLDIPLFRMYYLVQGGLSYQHLYYYDESSERTHSNNIGGFLDMGPWVELSDVVTSSPAILRLGVMYQNNLPNTKGSDGVVVGLQLSIGSGLFGTMMVGSLN